MNQLHNALSPYLLQHADNPVHWREWGEDAFAEARARDVPVLLSIGYAACHWCHVMAHESFECAETAALMNDGFVCIKVDREERPDIDRIYQAAHFVFAKRAGGWPLTMFLSPELGAAGQPHGEPFFGGTYFPKTARHGLPAFAEVLRRASVVWQERRAEVRAQNAQVTAMLRSLDDFSASEGDLTDAPICAAQARLRDHFDDENGGLGAAPKFPHAVELLFCLQTGDDALQQKARFALQKMAAGGLQDMLGGGFFRYCVDAVWQVPHFEKMLYDNALLLPAYACAAARFDDADCLRAAEGIVEWLRGMTDAEGAFYAAQDADGADGEGAFYLWREDELRGALAAEEHAALASHCGLAAAGAPRIDGKLHLLRRQTVAQTAAAVGMTESACAAALAAAVQNLRQARDKRVPPAMDDKILTAWNALMCAGLAQAGRLLRRPAWQALARRNFDTLVVRMRPAGRVLAARRGELLGGAGFLDDCANWLAAALELLRGEFCPSVLAMAQELAGELCEYYEDTAAGGFFLTAHDGEKLICRSKPIDDSATPCGNGVAARALLHLYALTGEARWQQAGERVLRVFYDAVCKQPAASTSYLLALDFYLRPPAMVFLAGEADACRQWREELEAAGTAALVYVLPQDISALPATLQKRAGAAGEPLAYWCDARGCRVMRPGERGAGA